jgi:thiol-disulfide isomerase/thioredoxin
MRGARWGRLAAIGALAAALGYGAWHLWRAGALPGSAPPAAAALLAARMPGLDGSVRSLGEWRGRVLVVNFWATWCTPCREEIPVFVRLQERYGERGLQFVGIAFDRPEPVSAFVREFRMNYPVLLGGIEAMDLMREAGNRAGALPFTLVLDRSGGIVGRELGRLKEDRLEALIGPLL